MEKYSDLDRPSRNALLGIAHINIHTHIALQHKALLQYIAEKEAATAVPYLFSNVLNRICKMQASDV